MYNVVSCFKGIVHYVNSNVIYASKGNKIFVSKDKGQNWKHIFNIPLAPLARAKSINKVSRRLFRMGVYHIRPVGQDRLVVMGFKKIYVFNLNTKRLEGETNIIGSRPLALCESNNQLFYGEYISNPERKPVRIFRSTNYGASWEVVYTLKNVRHIHGIYEDPLTGKIWVTTGDYKEEAAIWVTEDKFESLFKVVSGSQQTRAVQLVFTKNFVYYGTDTPLETNYIYRLSKKDYSMTKLTSVGNSVFYGCKVNGGNILFSTVCEPSNVNNEKEVEVWGCNENNDLNWVKILTVKKDLLPKKLFQYGQVLFPYIDGLYSTIWLTPFGTMRDQKSINIDISFDYSK